MVKEKSSKTFSFMVKEKSSKIFSLVYGEQLGNFTP